MELIGYLISLALIGLVVGALGRLVVPGPDPMGIVGTIVLGIVGGVLAGLLARALWGDGAAPGLLLAPAVTAVLVWMTRGSRRHSSARL